MKPLLPSHDSHCVLNKTFRETGPGKESEGNQMMTSKTIGYCDEVMYIRHQTERKWPPFRFVSDWKKC